MNLTVQATGLQFCQGSRVSDSKGTILLVKEHCYSSRHRGEAVLA